MLLLTAVTRVTKREALLAICENPGWQPPDCASVDRFLTELHQEGWIAPRLDGWEATPRALDEYPDFAEQSDIADPNPTPVPDPPPPPAAGTVPLERVELVVRALLEIMPLSSVSRLLATQPDQLPPREQDEMGWSIASSLVESLVS